MISFLHELASRAFDWWRNGRHRLVTLAIVTTAFGLLLGLALGHWRSSPGPYVRRLTMTGEWIKAPGRPGYVGYFRKRIKLPGPVKSAWIATAAREGFEVCVNQNPVSRFYLWRPTRPFQTGLGEGGQVMNPSPPALALNFPREYQWTSHRNDWLPVFSDITQSFVPGRNVITVEVESRRAPAAFRLDGEILLWSGERIRIDSGADWVAEPVPPFNSQHDWTETLYPDFDWRTSIPLVSPSLDAPDFHFQSFDPAVLTTPFAGRWLRRDARSTDAVWFRTEWDFPDVPFDAWIRLAVNRSFDLFINDRRVQLAQLGNPDLDSGDWVLGAPKGADLPAAPELLDPDEVGSLFVGDRFESPRHGDPSDLSFKPREDILNRTSDKARATSRSDLPGTYDPVKAEGQGIMAHDFLPSVPEPHDAKSLGRDRASGGLVAYNIRSMIQKGRNTIEVRLLPPLSPDPFGWAPQLAVDGSALFRDGSRLDLISGVNSDWTVRLQGQMGHFGPEAPCTVFGPAHQIGKPWPSTLYRGVAHDPSQLFMEKIYWILGSIATTWLTVAAVIGLNVLIAIRASRPKWRAVIEASGTLNRRFLLPPLLVLAAALLVENSWLERHESILFRIPRVWPYIFLAMAASTALLSRATIAAASRLIRLPKTPAWPLMIGVILVVCGVLRIYKLDFQPLDDDEYASCQAVVAIAHTGTPGFVPNGVYYSRSPFYHYLIGGIVWLFGDNLWAMRLPTAMFGIATALLIYRIGDKLMGRPWVGFGAMCFFTIHPFAIFSSHLVRFYQQQQFCSLLIIYWFCLGFLKTPRQGYRYLTMFAFLAAVLSQEISAIMVFQLAFGMFLFGRDAGWPNNMRFVLIVGVVLAWIVVDLLIFQIWCLTRTEGISPNVEASIKLHFWDPFNLISIFLGYSRLHVGPSIGLFLSAPLLFKRGGRVIWALAFFLLTGVLLTNVMVTHVSLRYQYWMIPLLFLISFRGIGLIAEHLAVAARLPGESDIRPVAAVLCLPIFVAFLLAFSPWRIIHSYDTKILNDSTGAFRYVRANLRPGDAIAANEPHPHAAFLESGHVNYDLSVPLLQDFVMLQKGRLIDRNAGAEVISSIDDLMEACRRHERLWVVVNREKFRTRGKNLRWEYPGARLELYLRKNFQVAHRSYLWTVFLWDRSQGHYEGFRGQ